MKLKQDLEDLVKALKAGTLPAPAYTGMLRVPPGYKNRKARRAELRRSRVKR